jgi:hypothetical protein
LRKHPDTLEVSGKEKLRDHPVPELLRLARLSANDLWRVPLSG